MHKPKLILFILISSILSACSGQQPVKILDHKSQADAINYINIAKPIVIHKNKKLSFDAFITEISNKRAVFVGEIHDRYDNHLNQLSILKALHQQNPNIGIGVE